MASSVSNYLKSIPNALKQGTADILSNSDFISRTIGMNNSYDDLMFIIQSLGREPVSLLGKDYLYIFDHVRRNYQQGTTVPSYMYGGGSYGCPKFTFYKEKPTVRFADPYFDIQNLHDAWVPNIKLNQTKFSTTNMYYAESNDGKSNNKSIQNFDANAGIANGQVVSSFINLSSCDLIKKTNDCFNAGKYKTLVARFHTNSDDSRSLNDPTQSAVTDKYGMSHGRNLLKTEPDKPNGYDNPYCRVWTYHHQYNQMARAIRPFGVANSAESLESLEQSDNYNTVGFRTTPSKSYGFEGGSKRLDRYGVLNYDNGFVNIAPTAKIKDYFEHKADDKDRRSVSTKRCMFSIENLAWRDSKNRLDEFEAYGLSAEQKGPLGGRIMWFPPYDLTFNEEVRVKWNSNEFIGRGENIYTYTNTERSGNISFTLLIDHPSILDYWTGNDRNGMENQGVPLIPGNVGGVDEINNQENTLLRFFAGCEVLSAKPQEYYTRKVTPETVKDLPKEEPAKPVNKNPSKAGETTLSGRHVMCCVLYFPNNYSGVGDRVPNSRVNPVHYLMNGIGCQKKVVNSNGSYSLEDIDTNINKKWNVNDVTYGGYEAGTSVSVAANPLSSSAAIRQSTYTEDKKCQYLTQEDGSRISATIGSEAFELGKIVGSKALPYNKAGNENWHYRRWYYRVDDGITYFKNGGEKSTYENDALKNQTSYLDLSSFNLNTDGYLKIKDNASELFKKLKEGVEKEDNFHLISFADIFYALEEDNQVIDQVDESNVKIVTDLMDAAGNGITIKKVMFIGCASQAGHKDENEKLANNRAATFREWVKSNGFPVEGEENKSETGETKTYPSPSVNNGDANSLKAKLHRCAIMRVEYEASKVEDAQDADKSVQQKPDGEIVTDTDSGSNNGAPLSLIDTVSNINTKTAWDWLNNTERGREILRTGYTTTEYYRAEDGTMKEKTVIKFPNRFNFTEEDILKITGEDYFNTASTNYNDSFKNLGISVSKSIVKRYDNEGEFFRLLEKNSPFMHHLITEKIKYFDPAYHSISPEGFNARLTFLQQCCRQGPTVGNSDYEAKTAYNLAFGRPPVCVLRLGDFYYTKIIINSMSIQYENAQWDLNPEGIGVMPTFAKVSLSFTFLGGSDLAGPISRLQNAVSFNYYANASVYDNRAERVLYSDSGDGKEVKYKPFNYPYTSYSKRSATAGDGSDASTNDNVQRNGDIFEDA